MNSSLFLGIATFLYLIIMAVCFLQLFVRNKIILQLMYAVTVCALVIHAAGWCLRWYESYEMGHGHIPLSNMYESLISLSMCLVIVFLVIVRKYKTDTLGVFVFPIVSLSMAYASISPNIQKNIEPLIPALQSNWLTYHVITCFLGYAAFAVSFGASIAYLLKRDAGTQQQEGVLPLKSVLDEVIYKANAVGFLMLGIGIITGAVWANYAWGSYWSWDPKETWSLITWLIYAVFLHARLQRGWRGKKTAVLSIIGFCAVIFTFLGVNYVLSGLHSYA